MTEVEWLEYDDPVVVLYYLPYRPSDRKLRLFACACGHRIWHLLPKEDRKIVEMSERFVEGLASTDDLAALVASHDPGFAHYWISCLANKDAREAARIARYFADVRVRDWLLDDGPPGVESMLSWQDIWKQERREQAKLLREILGNPLRPVSIDPFWTLWNDGTVPKLAMAIYEDRRFENLPILADALEEAGCDNAAVLNHCRQPGEHVRGCWVLDLLLGKE